MSRIKQFFERRKNDFEYKTVTAAVGSFAATAFFALYNGFLGIHHRSLWHGTICVYYIVLVVLRGIIIVPRKSVSTMSDPEHAQTKIYVVSAELLLFLNICLIIPVSIMVVRQRPVNITLIPAIAVAAYTTYKVTMAFINLKKKKQSSDSLVRMLRTISFIEALVAILTLQNTLIMVNMKDDSTDMLMLMAFTSAAVMLAAVTMSVVALIKGIANLRGNRN